MDPARATQLALGYWPARAFSAALELGVFDVLPASADEVATRLGLRSPSVPDLLDALVGLGVLAVDGGRYSIEGTVDPALVEVAGGESYRAWADLPARLRGDPTPSMFETLDDEELARFAGAMARASAPGHEAIATLPLAGTVLDVGGADGALAVLLAERNPSLRVITFDLAAMSALAEVRAAPFADRVTAIGGDFRFDPWPAADVVVLSLVLLDWPVEVKQRLLASAAAAAPRIVILDRLDDGAPRGERPTFELLRSLHLLVTHGDAHPYTAGELTGWLAEAGYGSPTLTAVDGGFTLAVADRAG